MTDVRAAAKDVETATAALLHHLDSLDDPTARGASLLPGWSVGHVLTHICRNADGMSQLVDWALTGVPRPMYTSMEARESDIAAGSSRSAADLRADVAASAGRLATRLADLAAARDECRNRLVLLGAPPPGTVPDMPAHEIPVRRLREVLVHHVDLGLPGYGPEDWPDSFVTWTLAWLDHKNGPAPVTGEPHEVLAWRLGRGAGLSVRATDGGDPGVPPAW